MQNSSQVDLQRYNVNTIKITAGFFFFLVETDKICKEIKGLAPPKIFEKKKVKRSNRLRNRVWDGYVHTAIFKMDNRQGPTVQHPELYSVLYDCLEGRAVLRGMDTRIMYGQFPSLSTETITTFLINYQFSSVAQSCPTLCDLMNSSTPASLSITNCWSLPKPMSIE